MGKNKTGRPSWFKLFLHYRPVIDVFPNEAVGKAFKAALLYFDTGDVEELDSMANAIFSALRPHIDEAFEDFQRSVNTGRAGGQKRWGKDDVKRDRPPIGPLYPPIGVSTEEDTEEDAEEDAEEEGDTADEPTKPARFFPPSVYDVRAYCGERGYTTIDPERFVSYYAARNWFSGKTAITDWRAAVDLWNRNDVSKREAKETPIPTEDAPTGEQELEEMRRFLDSLKSREEG